MVRWPSGLRHFPAKKEIGLKPGPRVRIPLSPPDTSFTLCALIERGSAAFTTEAGVTQVGLSGRLRVPLPGASKIILGSSAIKYQKQMTGQGNNSI